MLKKVLAFLFYLLFFLTPLIFLPVNNELFEFNKMLFVYILTILLSGLWIIRMFLQKEIIFRPTPLDIPLLFFLGSQLFSTIFSIDPHTSIWGYYSRSNGGLLSTISYLLLYWVFVSNFSGEEVLKFLKAALLGGLAVSLWAIPEHFGHSLSCLFLTGDFNDSCWVQDVASRVFATLGQPNWLAAYLEMLIFPAFYFALTAKTKIKTMLYTLFSILFYAAFTFTYSRGATLGIGAGILLFGVGIFWIFKRSNRKRLSIILSLVLASFVLINIFFGSALSRFQLLTQPSNSSQSSSNSSQGGVSQLDEESGTESGEIRLIVWKGALDIFKHYPVFGSGVETFAYSYYQYRPLAQNSVSEWDFLYNKAHNEYLNYLATTGLVGFLSYMLIIGVFIFWCLKNFLYSKAMKPESKILILSILSAYIAYLIQNFFQFSVVIIAVFFYIFPAIVFSFQEDLELWPFPKPNFSLKFSFPRKVFLMDVAIVLVSLIMGVLLINIAKEWLADVEYAKGLKYLDNGEAGQSYYSLIDATNLNSREPLYKLQLGFAASSLVLGLNGQDATLSAELKTVSLDETEKGLNISPKNVTLWETAIRTYFELASTDPSYNQKTLQAVNMAIGLSPTDPKLYYNKGLVLASFGESEEALQAFDKALLLKPDYHDCLVSLADFYSSQNQPDKAKVELQKVLKYFPNDPEASQKLQQIASESAQK